MKNRILSFVLALTLAVSALLGTAVFVGAEGSGAKLENAALNLAENITVKMLASIESPAEGDYARVTLPNGKTLDTLLSDADRYGENYIFYAKVAIKDFAKDIKLEIFRKDATEPFYTEFTSAEAYCESYKEKYPSGDFIGLVAALELYAAAAAAYFNGGEPVSVDVDIPESEAKIGGTLPDGLTHYSATLLLESETTVRHYFTVANGHKITDYTFFVDLDGDEEIDPAEKLAAYKKATTDGSAIYYADIAGITPNELDKAYTLYALGKDGNEYFCTYGALTYAKNKENSQNSRLANLVKALYNYNKVASELKGTVIFDGADEMTYEYGVTTPIVKPLTKENATFVGWADKDGNIVTEILPGQTGKVELTSVWSEGANIHHYGFDYNKLTGMNYCANHADTDSDGKCNSCQYCADITACGAYSKTTCQSCGKGRVTYAKTGSIEWTDSVAAVAYPVTVDSTKASIFALSGASALYAVVSDTSDKSFYSMIFDADGNLKTDSVTIEMSLGKPTAEQVASVKGTSAIYGAIPDKYITTVCRLRNPNKQFVNFFTITKDGYVDIGAATKLKLNDGINNFKLVIDVTGVTDDEVLNDTLIFNLFDGNGDLVASNPFTLAYDISTYTREQICEIRLDDGGYLLWDDLNITAQPLANSVVYPEDVTLPEGTATTFTPGEALPLAEGATKSGYEFAGWYADAELTNPINEVPENAVGSFRVYAKWIKPIVKEDYSKTALDFVDKTYLYHTESSTQIKYYETNGVVTTYKTEELGGEEYLYWKTAAGKPQILLETSGIANAASDQISYIFEFAYAGNDTDMKIAVGARNKNKTCNPVFFKIENGNVVFNNQVVATVDDDFTEIKVVLDFAKGEIRLSTSEGYEIYSASVTLEGRETFTREVFQILSNSAGEIKIGAIKAYAGDILAD